MSNICLGLQQKLWRAYGRSKSKTEDIQPIIVVWVRLQRVAVAMTTVAQGVVVAVVADVEDVNRNFTIQVMTTKTFPNRGMKGDFP
jgi:hypothetical protein